MVAKSNKPSLFASHFSTAFGPMRITGALGGVLSLEFLTEDPDSDILLLRPDKTFPDVIKAVQRYLKGNPRALSGLRWKRSHGGTAFQNRVWKAIREIPAGQTRTYGELAVKVGSPGGGRAVGAACGANPVLLLTPCHRVLSSGGRLGGFSCGLDLKKRLLKLEGFQV